MKKASTLWLIFGLMTLSLGCVSTRQLAPEEMVVERIISATGSQSELYSSAMDWISSTFRSAKTVVSFSDTVTGKIVGNSVEIVPLAFGIPAEVNYRFTIQVKDGRARITADNAYYTTVTDFGIITTYLDNEFSFNQSFRPIINVLFDSFEKRIKSGPENW